MSSITRARQHFQLARALLHLVATLSPFTITSSLERSTIIPYSLMKSIPSNTSSVIPVTKTVIATVCSPRLNSISEVPLTAHMEPSANSTSRLDGSNGGLNPGSIFSNSLSDSNDTLHPVSTRTSQAVPQTIPGTYKPPPPTRLCTTGSIGPPGAEI